MQQTSELYNSILQALNHWFEYKVVINGVEYGENYLRSVSTNIEMLQKEPEIGQVVAGEVDVEMNLPTEIIPSMALIRPYVRACDSSRQSEWIPQGVFYIDTRTRTKNDSGLDVLKIHGFDAMLKTEQLFESSTITGDSTDTAMVNEIASIIGVEVDSRTYTVMNQTYTIPLPTGYTLREVLGYIAAAYVGCFVITDEGKLRLVSLLELPPETNYLIEEQGYAITFGGDRILV